MKRAIVLSGGGAKGAFQFGALQYIYEEWMVRNPEYNFQIVAGISAGALNGALIAQNKFQYLKEFWNNISNDSIYKGSLGFFPALWHILIYKTCAMSNAPLHKNLSNLVFLKDFDFEKVDFRFGAVSLSDGEYKMFHAANFDADDQLVNAILASATMPAIWPPVKDVRLKSGEKVTNLIDGGVRNSNPLGDVIGDDPDEIVIINCNPPAIPADPNSAENILKIMKRALTDITINEIFRSDVNEFLRVNKIISQLPEGVSVNKPNGKPYKKYKCLLIEPGMDLGDPLDFSTEQTNLRMKHGYEVAKQLYENPMA